MCRRVTIQSIEAESFGKSENYLKQKKQWTHTGSGSLSGGARKAQAAAAAGRFLVGAAEQGSLRQPSVSTAATCAAAALDAS